MAVAVGKASVSVAVEVAVGVGVTMFVGKVISVLVTIGADVGENGAGAPQASVKYVKSIINKSVYLVET